MLDQALASLAQALGHSNGGAISPGGCEAIYEELCNWALLARTLIQAVNILAGSEPEKGLLVLLDRALPLIPAEDPSLRLSAEMLRVECLIEALQSLMRLCRLFAGPFTCLLQAPDFVHRFEASLRRSLRLLDAPRVRASSGAFI